MVNASLLLKGCEAYERTNTGVGNFNGSAKDVADATACQGWIIGVFHSLIRTGVARYCWPEDETVTWDRMVRILLAHFRRHPQRLHVDSVSLANEAFSNGFPCPQHDVAYYQARLSDLGYDAGPADGLIGERTRAAIRAYQRQQGLAQSGQLTDEVKHAIDGDFWDIGYRSRITPSETNN